MTDVKSLKEAYSQSQVVLKGALLLVVLVVIDQVTKQLAPEIIENEGFFLHSFTWSSPFIRIFCSLGLLLLSVFIISTVQFLTLKRSPSLFYTLMLFEAGLIGNGMDKVQFGFVRDFIQVHWFQPVLVLNIADLYQWVSFLGLLILIWRNPKSLWPEHNSRNALLVFPLSQLRLSGGILLVSFLLSVSNFILLLAYLQASHALVSYAEFSVCFMTFSLFMLFAIGFFSLIWSHRIYSPFRGVIRYLQLLVEGKTFEIKTRKNDDAEPVQEALALIQELVKKNQ